MICQGSKSFNVGLRTTMNASVAVALWEFNVCNDGMARNASPVPAWEGKKGHYREKQH